MQFGKYQQAVYKRSSRHRNMGSSAKTGNLKMLPKAYTPRFNYGYAGANLSTASGNFRPSLGVKSVSMFLLLGYMTYVIGIAGSSPLHKIASVEDSGAWAGIGSGGDGGGDDSFFHSPRGEDAGHYAPIDEHTVGDVLSEEARSPKLSVAGLSEPRLERALGAMLTDDLGIYTKLVDGSRAYLTLDVRLQKRAEEILAANKVPWGALVAIEPKTGRVLALAEHSVEEDGANVALRATFPAASLFKLITSAAAIEKAGMKENEKVNYRGGDYTLTRANYKPSGQQDRKSMSLATALGKSCNPVFARVALGELDIETLERYAVAFGFNTVIPFQMPLECSSFAVEDDDYSFARTAAGFGEVKISPLHAALVAAALGNSGTMMVPQVVDNITSPTGQIIYKGESRIYKKSVLPSTAENVISMMKETVQTGTARRYFNNLAGSRITSEQIAGKTGTLRGTNPEGTYFWFVGVLPTNSPEIAIAALVIDPGYSGVKGSKLASSLVSYYLGIKDVEVVETDGQSDEAEELGEENGGDI